MNNYYVVKASLNRPTLVFKEGSWYRKGRFELNNGTRGKFVFRFFNGYRQELFVTCTIDSYRYIRSETFDKYSELFSKQIIEYIKPNIKNTVTEIRQKEANITNPPIEVLSAPSMEGYITAVFSIKGESDKRQLLLQKIDDGEWEFNQYNIGRMSGDFVSSTWLNELWKQVQKHEEAMFPLLL